MKTAIVTLFLRLPESLLLLCIIAMPLLTSNSPLDIQLKDTYYVFGGNTWMGNILFLPFYLMLLLSWSLHALLRRRDLLAKKWRWAQVGGSVLCILVIVVTTLELRFIMIICE